MRKLYFLPFIYTTALCILIIKPIWFDNPYKYDKKSVVAVIGNSDKTSLSLGTRITLAKMNANDLLFKILRASLLAKIVTVPNLTKEETSLLRSLKISDGHFLPQYGVEYSIYYNTKSKIVYAKATIDKTIASMYIDSLCKYHIIQINILADRNKKLANSVSLKVRQGCDMFMSHPRKHILN